METSSQQNLELIATMIKSAKRNFYESSVYFILWGIAISTASSMHYFFMKNTSISPGIIWLVVIPSALIFQFFVSRKQKKNKKIRTHIESLLTNMWIAFGITLFIVLFFSSKLGLSTYPMVLSLYAMGTFVSGSAFKINAFIIGSIVCWILAIICFFVPFEIQLLLLALGALLAFVYPGITLYLSGKKTYLQENKNV